MSLADKTHNLEETASSVSESGESFWERFKKGRQGSLWYYATLLEIYRARLRKGELQGGGGLERAGRLVGRLEAALERICPDPEERRTATSWEPVGS